MHSAVKLKCDEKESVLRTGWRRTEGGEGDRQEEWRRGSGLPRPTVSSMSEEFVGAERDRDIGRSFCYS